MPCAIMRGREPAGYVQHARALSEVAKSLLHDLYQLSDSGYH